jgi:Gpi18-like mannosyltransferase
MFTALEWLAEHTGWSFRVLGKLPIVAGDMLVGWLIYATLRRHRHPERVALAGMLLYLFNPLVLYNGAFYGRFDAIALAFLLLALENYRTRWFAPAFALAISAKTFPLFMLPLLAFGRDRQILRRLILACGLALVLALPYVITDPDGLLSHLLYARGSFGRLSWYYLFLSTHWLPEPKILTLAHFTTYLYPVILLAFVHRPLYMKAALCFTLYLVLNHVVYEQYLLWPLPFLIIVGLHYRSRVVLVLMVFCTLAGILENEHTWAHSHDPYLRYILLPTPCMPLNVALALGALVFILIKLRHHESLQYDDQEIRLLEPIPMRRHNSARGVDLIR